jgi:ankyrin repeat protein
VEVLLPYSKIDTQDVSFDTPLMAAITGEYVVLVKLLLRHSCDVNLANKVNARAVGDLLH